jgi:glycine oxidase
VKIAIIGGGIAGLAIGWRLAEQGADVTVFERDVAGRGATWAAAGMLSAGAEADSMGGAQSFARHARNQWPAFARELETASGKNCLYRETGALVVAHDDAGAAAIREEGDRLRASGAEAILLDREAAHEKEPVLAPHIASALFVPGDADVDNRILGEALLAAFTRAGGTLREHCAVNAIHIENDHAAGVVTTERPVRADVVVVAMGAWSGSIAGVPADFLPPVQPCKGQLIAFASPNDARLPKHIIGDHHVYLVPRGDRVLVGATVEDAGFDTSVDRVARDELAASAARIIPAAADWPVVEAWAGLRPRSADDAPVLGETSLPGLFVASGQFRNGILFAPAVAEAMTSLILGHAAPFDIAAFHPRRFASS